MNVVGSKISRVKWLRAIQKRVKVIYVINNHMDRKTLAVLGRYLYNSYSAKY